MNLSLSLSLGASSKLVTLSDLDDFANLDLWLDATVGVTFDGSNDVSQWDDQSTNGFDVTQGVGANQPDHVANSQNGLPGIDFNGTTDYLERVMSDFSNQGVGTFFYVVSAVDALGVAEAFTSSDIALTTQTCRFFFRDRVVEIQMRDDSVGFNDTLQGVTTINADANLIMFQSDGSTITCEINGSSETLNVSAGGNNGNWLGDVTDRDNIVLAALIRTSVTSISDLIIHEMGIYSDAKSAADILTITNRLKAKWGI